MNTNSLLMRSIVIGLVAGSVAMAALVPQGVLADAQSPNNQTLVESADPTFCLEPSVQVVKTIKMIATAYSSSWDETTGIPGVSGTITASGKPVADNIIANNMLPFGTRVMIDGRIFTVEDRMNAHKGKYQLDIWMPSKQQAKEFGAKLVDVQILQS